MYASSSEATEFASFLKRAQCIHLKVSLLTNTNVYSVPIKLQLFGLTLVEC